MLHSRGMAGSKRVLGFPRAFVPGAVACVVWGASACSNGGGVAPYAGAGGAQNPGAAGFEATSTAGSLTGAGAGGPVPPFSAGPPACVLPERPDPVFNAQAVLLSTVARRELYSWTTDEQAAALRRDRVLFTTVEQKGLGPGYAFAFLSQLAIGATDPQQQQLANVLNGDLFSKKRYAWSEPWATRLGWPGEDYGSNLLRIVLKPEAWLVIVTGGLLSVTDLDNRPVAISEALSHPERIGAVYYVRDASSGGPVCNGSFLG